MHDNRHELWLTDHEKRIRGVEVNQAVITDNVSQIRKWSGWGVALLAGSFLIQLLNVVIKGWIN